MCKQDRFVFDRLSEKSLIQREKNGWALETGYREQWDHRGHRHWLQWIFLDLFEPLDVKVLKTCHPWNVSRNLLGTVSHLVSVAGTAGPSSDSHFGCSLGISAVRKPWGCEPDLLLRTVSLMLQVVVTLPALPLILKAELDLWSS